MPSTNLWEAQVADSPRTDPGQTAVEPVFFELGASWYWLLLGPAAGLVMLFIEINSGLGPQPVVPLAFVVLVSGFLGLQVKAARIHTSVELTDDTLREGTERLPVDQIRTVYQELPVSHKSGLTPPKWQSARALGELTGVPRGRSGIGLKLADGRTVQAWARRHRELRAALTQLVEQRGPRPTDSDFPRT
jgi:hypothetical protein